MLRDRINSLLTLQKSALAYRNDSCDNTLSRINVGISTTSTTSRSTSKSSGGLYKGDEYLRSTSTSTSGNIPHVRYPKGMAYGYDPESVDGIGKHTYRISNFKFTLTELKRCVLT